MTRAYPSRAAEKSLEQSGIPPGDAWPALASKVALGSAEYHFAVSAMGFGDVVHFVGLSWSGCDELAVVSGGGRLGGRLGGCALPVEHLLLILDLEKGTK